MTATAGRLALVALLAIAPACAPPPVPEVRVAVSGDAREVVLFFAARAWGDVAERAAREVGDLLATTDVLGRTGVAFASAPDAERADLPRALDAALAELARRGCTVRTAVALVGDLSLLHAVDPSRPPEVHEGLSSRDLARQDVAALVAALAASARAAGTGLVLATAPIGRQAAIEVPELVEAADWLRALAAGAGPTGGPAAVPLLDLAQAFAPRSGEGLFDNGLDRLDPWGADELVRVLRVALDEDDGPLPARDEAERGARAQDRALRALAFGSPAQFEALLPAALQAAIPTPRHAARRAVLELAAEGPEVAQPAVFSVRETAHATGRTGEAPPGLALGRVLCGLPAGAGEVHDEVEDGLLALLRPHDRSAGPVNLVAEAQDLVARHPERLEAWFALQAVLDVSPKPRDVRADALRQLAAFQGSAVSTDCAGPLLAGWPATLRAVPALLAALRPVALLPPDTALLGTIRRRAALGFERHGANLLDREFRDLRLPPSWQQYRQELVARADAREALEAAGPH